MILEHAKLDRLLQSDFEVERLWPRLQVAVGSCYRIMLLILSSRVCLSVRDIIEICKELSMNFDEVFGERMCD